MTAGSPSLDPSASDSRLISVPKTVAMIVVPCQRDALTSRFLLKPMGLVSNCVCVTAMQVTTAQVTTVQVIDLAPSIRRSENHRCFFLLRFAHSDAYSSELLSLLLSVRHKESTVVPAALSVCLSLLLWVTTILFQVSRTQRPLPFQHLAHFERLAEESGR